MNNSLYHIKSKNTEFKNDEGKQQMNRKTFRWLFYSFLVLHLCFYLWGHNFNGHQARKLTTGFSFEMAKEFIYFYYYKGLFPVASLAKDKEYSKQGAEKQIKENGVLLTMEYKHWSRMGENARIVAFIPNAILKGDPEKPDITLFNALIFVTALMMVFKILYKQGYGYLGLAIVLIITFTPFYQYEVYKNNNIFGLLASIYLIVLAINFKLIYSNNFNKIMYLLPIVTGVIIGFFVEVRGEILAVLISGVLLYLVSRSLKWVNKIVFIVILFISFIIVRNSVRNHFDNKFDEAYELVQKSNGHTYEGGKTKMHTFWHPVFCGLGDFDTKYGYEWNDVVAYNYAIPYLEKTYNQKFPYSNKYHFDLYYDADSLYYIKPEEIPAYESIVKNKVLSDIKKDPLWYTGILLKRIIRIFSNTIPIPLLGWLSLLIAYFAFKRKKWLELKLILISLPLSLTPLIMFSGGNATFNSMFPLITLAILISKIFESSEFLKTLLKKHKLQKN